MDYDVVMVPPIFADKGTLEFFCEDVSLNSVWRFSLNSLSNFFDIEISHILFQINPEKFLLQMDSYSDMTQLISQ